MSVLVPTAVYHTLPDTLFWDLPGVLLAAPASALCGWKGVIALSLWVWVCLEGWRWTACSGVAAAYAHSR